MPRRYLFTPETVATTSGILLPRKEVWTRQPPGPANLRKDGALSKDAWVFSGQTPLDSLGKPLTSFHSFSPSEIGVGVFTTTSNPAVFESSQSFADQNVTVGFFVKPGTNASATTHGFISTCPNSTTAGWRIATNTANQLRWTWQSSGGGLTDVLGPTWSYSSSPVVVVVRVDTAANVLSFFVNGNKTDVGSGAVPGTMSSVIRLGSLRDTSFPYEGTFVNAFIDLYAWSDEHIAEYSRNPWGAIFEPANRPIFIAGAAGGGTSDAVGSAAGTGAASGVGSSTADSVGSSSGIGATPGVGASLFDSVGSAAGVGAAPGVGTSSSGSTGTAAGTSTSAAIGQSTADSVGSAAGVGAAPGIGSSVAAGSSVGSAAGIATAAAVGASTFDAVGTSAGIATALAVGSYLATVDAVGSASGTSTALGVSEAEASVTKGGQRRKPRHTREQKNLKKQKEDPVLDAIIANFESERAEKKRLEQARKEVKEEQKVVKEEILPDISDVIKKLKELQPEVEVKKEDSPKEQVNLETLSTQLGTLVTSLKGISSRIDSVDAKMNKLAKQLDNLEEVMIILNN